MSTVTSKAPTAARLLVGVIFFVFGLNGFFQFLPAPAMGGGAGAFVGALHSTGYMLPLIKTTEVLGGLLLLLGRFVPLALALLAPVVVNITMFHLVLAPSGLAIPVVLFAAMSYLAWSYRDAFRPMLQATNVPHRSAESHPHHAMTARV